MATVSCGKNLLRQNLQYQESEVAMPEPESVVLIEKLRRANRRWKTAATSLALVLTMLVVNIFWEVQEKAHRAAAVEAEMLRHLAEVKALRAAADGAHQAAQESFKQLEKAKQETEKTRRQ